MDESGGASPENPNPFVHHQKIRFVDFGDFNELSVIWEVTRKNEKIRKTRSSESSLQLIFPNAQRLPLIPGKVLVYGNLTGNL